MVADGRWLMADGYIYIYIYTYIYYIHAYVFWFLHSLHEKYFKLVLYPRWRIIWISHANAITAIITTVGDNDLEHIVTSSQVHCPPWLIIFACVSAVTVVKKSISVPIYCIWSSCIECVIICRTLHRWFMQSYVIWKHIYNVSWVLHRWFMQNYIVWKHIYSVGWVLLMHKRHMERYKGLLKSVMPLEYTSMIQAARFYWKQLGCRLWGSIHAEKVRKRLVLFFNSDCGRSFKWYISTKLTTHGLYFNMAVEKSPFYQHGSTSILAWIRSHTPS